ncbi:hypothetical protein BJF79_16960 [Actinomadura sp. CNU-125]|uniref:hypothetical protein n=1 Tax=Actinomadura sp. CNU-125 TaxID=1904961 RepID=UPI00095B8E3B|nr:hypothetical protein [Actinomadura sp. CNU-125]OLT19257.1 hypothetical protein BJF79_16960 [Actinomadura sp. CNU-125]
MPVTITVPEETTARFVVAADRIPGDIAALIRRALPGPQAEAVSDRFGTPGLMISAHPADSAPWKLEHATGVDAADAEAIERAKQHIGVTSVMPADDLPVALHLARTTALLIAEEICGVPVDVDTDRILPALRPGDFVLADEWLGVSLPPYRNGGRCEAGPDEGCACVRLRSRGLRRFGLPELEITGVACTLDVAALNILRTTAQRLLPLGRHPGHHTVSSEPALTGTDFAAFWGGGKPMWDGAPVRVRLTAPAPGRLAIEQPEDFPGTLNDWLWDELPPVLYQVLSREPDRTPATSPPGG